MMARLADEIFTYWTSLCPELQHLIIDSLLHVCEEEGYLAVR